VECGTSGEVFVSDSGNHRVRLISNGVITTIAGSGAAGLAGDGGSAPAAALNSPQKIALGKDGSLYIADRANRRVRRVDAAGRIESLHSGSKPLTALMR
jgi:hypothetical protein